MRKIAFRYKNNRTIKPIDWDNWEITADDMEIEFLSLQEVYDTIQGLISFVGLADLAPLRELADLMSDDKTQEIKELKAQIDELKGKLNQKGLCEWANRVNGKMKGEEV